LPTPYIGITDFMNAGQARKMLKALADTNVLYRRRLGVGVMMSWKTLNGRPTKWSKAFPKNEDVAGIFINNAWAFNVLHYADYDSHPVLENLTKAAEYGGPQMNAMQLDMPWPDVFDVRKFRQLHPDVQIIIQASTVALDAVNNSPHEMIQRLEAYGDSIDYVLLDKSMGRGLGMDAQALIPFATAIVEGIPRLGLVAAGGLGPDTLHLVEPLAETYPGVSTDAQGKLRPSGSALNPVDWAMAQAYLEKAARYFDELYFDTR